VAWRDCNWNPATERTRFAPGSSSDTVVYRIFADYTGRLWMACGDFHQNHVTVSQCQEELRWSVRAFL